MVISINFNYYNLMTIQLWFTVHYSYRIYIRYYDINKMYVIIVKNNIGDLENSETQRILVVA